MPNHALIILTGHVGKAEETKYLPQGDAVLRFSLCVNTGFGDKKTASWYDCSLFGKRAEKIAMFISKGKPITVIGEPSIRKWESNGKAGTSVSVRVADIVLLGGRDDGHAIDSQPRETQAEQEPMPTQASIDQRDNEEIPF